MSKREYRKPNIPAERRTIREPRSSSMTRRRINQWAGGNPWAPLENAKILRRNKSEPFSWNAGVEEVTEAAVFDRRRRDFYSPQQSPPECSQEYNKETKVVVNVTVEGSPGPVQRMVKLGSNVEELIKLVVIKYKQERRVPNLHNHNDAPFYYELHPSYFSLQGLRNSDLIGDIGSRSFYLRRCSRAENNFTSSSDIASFSFLPSSIARIITRIIRGTRKFWKMFGCIP